MSEPNGPHHPIAEAMRTAAEEAAVRDRVNKPHVPGAEFGAGIGNVGGWVVLFGMIGAVLGGLLGRGLTGAVVGAVMLGGLMGAVGFVGQLTSGIWNRGPVWVWVILGAVVGAIFGGMIDSDPSGWGLAGMMALGAFRYVMKDEQ